MAPHSWRCVMRPQLSDGGLTGWYLTEGCLAGHGGHRSAKSPIASAAALDSSSASERHGPKKSTKPIPKLATARLAQYTQHWLDGGLFCPSAILAVALSLVSSPGNRSQCHVPL